MKNNEKYKRLMNGSIVELTQYELWNILTNQHELNINTIAVQKNSEGNFVCFVDAPTIKAYKREV